MQQGLRYDHYKVLGLPRDADARAIKKAYRERVKQWHPDHNASGNAPEIFHALHDAYLTLSDAESRAAYDDRLRFYRQAQPSEASAAHHTRHAYHIPKDPERDLPVNRFAFVGLHLTGLLFGIALVSGLVIGVFFLGWPAYTLFFCAPGLAVIPDSIAGLRPK
ncbi:MAG: J domain-containing protein [Flavobacteriales bacterium]|nr:J domain-containing protein [Flavobacteriales bacterium]